MTPKEQSLPWRLMHLAARPEGVCADDVPDKERKAYHKTMSRLLERGQCSRKQDGRLSRYFAKPSQLEDYKNPKLGRPTEAHVSRPAIETIRHERLAPLTINPKRMPGKAPWSADAPAHLPYDDAGRPLWKFTACPGFTGDPIKTNTFTGAY